MTDEVKHIWETTCEVFEADLGLIHSRKLEQVFAKQAVWMMLKERGWYDRQIAKEMGFDRSTICHGRLSAESSLKYVKGYKERYQELERRCEELG